MEPFETFTKYFSEALLAAAMGIAIITIIAYAVKSVNDKKNLK